MNRVLEMGGASLEAQLQALPEDKQEHLMKQLQAVDLEQLQLQRLQLEERGEHPKRDVSPLTTQLHTATDEDQRRGEEALARGQLGCLIVAGGQGTRLRFEGPKGLYPVTRFQKKSLFQYLAEKVGAASRAYGVDLPLAIMTSPLNDQETRAFFAANANFGLKPTQVAFFCQGTLPLLLDDGSLFLSNADTLATGPNGNGVTLQHFHTSEIYQRWRDQGVEHLSFVQIDNALVDPFDTGLFGTHLDGADVTIQSIYRNNPKEKVGLIAVENERVCVVEYSEMSAQEAENPAFTQANISRFLFSLDFIAEVAKRSDEMPFHLAHKAVPFLGTDGDVQWPKQPNAWKFEKFIFDCLRMTRKTRVVPCSRELCFAPLKNAEGPDSLQSVQEALLRQDRAAYQAVSECQIPHADIELHPQFFYPTPELVEKWRGITDPSGYCD